MRRLWVGFTAKAKYSRHGGLSQWTDCATTGFIRYSGEGGMQCLDCSGGAEWPDQFLMVIFSHPLHDCRQAHRYIA